MKHLVAIMLATMFIARPGMNAFAYGAQQADPKKEETAVYLAVLTEMFSEIPLLVIRQETVKDSFLEFGDWQNSKQSPAPSQEAVEDYNTRNKESRHFRSLDIKTKHVFLEQKEYDQIFKNGVAGWKEFYEKYPDSGGYIGFSRVGFDAELSQALVYVVQGCGGKCGTGRYVLLKKDGGAWKVVTERLLWTS
jgi:hypothetical protein